MAMTPLKFVKTTVLLKDINGVFGTSHTRTWDAGPLLQGVMMERVAPNIADALHQGAFNAYSQNVTQSERGIVWTINALTGDIQTRVVEPCLDGQEIELKKIGAQLRVQETIQRTLPFQELTTTVREATQRRFNLTFYTPTSFKSSGFYQNIPSMHLIYQNLAMHYGLLYDGSSEVDQEMVDYLCDHTRICRYRLNSQGFRVARAVIPSFTGTMTVDVNGSQSIVGFAHMLFRFATFAGVGIKTSMGMGGFGLGYPQPRRSATTDEKGRCN